MSTRFARRSGVQLALAVAALSFTAPAPVLSAQSWYANLSPEVPGATGSGFATFLVSGVANNLLTISTSWSGLSSTTTVAHIHCCTAVPNAGTIGVAVTPGTLPGFPVGVTFGSYTTTVNLDLLATYTSGFVTNFGGGTIAGAKAALLASFDNGRSYLNIHSTTFPGGEIRGFVTTVPEPASVMFLAAGLACLAVPLARRRARA